ncbi:fungal trichothecene efflux pump [Clohesyomyces aquaticus]|uniref:Fungal trichothecene efflux pump n=1 Tax=Clohesyomyces aquaticus TaxID=1231657 RepID=A0A1Y1YYE2_9PLEO|nr:fungal trichothecene efflux pump [Clohesyomyces aquaticus]
MICGANSDLFGRRWFLIMGNVLLFVGHLMCGLAKNGTTMIAGFAIIGFGAGNAQLAAFALPELLPNKWRHISITIADLGTWIAVVVGPIAARYAIVQDTWRWLFHAPTIGAAISVVALYFLYFPPQHPRGLPFGAALRELDYIGGVLFILAGTLILVGILYTQIIPSSSPKVIGLLVGGFGALLGFIGYEHFAPNLTQPLTPTHIFTKDKGREFTAPFIVGFVVTMFYYMTNIVYPTQCAVLFLNETSTIKESVLLTLPSNIGLVFGEILLMIFGTPFGHWKWTLTGSVTIMVFFGALLGLGDPTRKTMMMVFVFLSQTGFGWAQMLSITFIQFGVPQVELGVSGGLAGVSRFAGGAIAISVYSTILSNTLTTSILSLVPAAVTPLGLPATSIPLILGALPKGSKALSAVPGITPEIMAAAGAAFQQAYTHALRVTALSSLSFGIIAIIACICCNDIGKKMNEKIEVFLENDEFADRNRFH